MEFICGLHNLHSHHYGYALTIGNFDGFHKGHQALIKKLKIESYRRKLPTMVVIFEPQPEEYFLGNSAPARLSCLRDKIKYFSAAGIDSILCIPFNMKFSAISARSFIVDVLVQRLGMKFIGIGDDFKFGARRTGNYELLKKIGEDVGFEVIKIVPSTEEGRRVSSTSIREALIQDQIIKAEKLLGHSYRISGRVIHGDELGRKIGFPTANISLKKWKVPIHGVYAVEVHGVFRSSIPGVANIGVRPTVIGLRNRLEVYLIDISTIDLYGSHIEIVIRKKIRSERRFSSLEELRRQIFCDVTSVRNFFRFKTFS